jgi:hypothetical protein
LDVIEVVSVQPKAGSEAPYQMLYEGQKHTADILFIIPVNLTSPE